jgi:hypothetical protein
MNNRQKFFNTRWNSIQYHLYRSYLRNKKMEKVNPRIFENFIKVKQLIKNGKTKENK